MKKYFVILNIFITIVLSLCFVYTKIQIELTSKPAYGLSVNSKEISIFSGGYKSNTEGKDLHVISDLYKILSYNKILLVSENIDNPGLGVFDPNGNYDFSNFDKANYNKVIVKKNSYTSKITSIDNTFKSIGNNIFNIIGTYDEEYPLYNKDKEYIYNFFDEPSLNGYYYIDHKNQVLLNKILLSEIVPLLEKYHYIVNIEEGFGDSPKVIIRNLFSNSIYVLTIFVLFFMYINLFLNYINISKRLKKTMNIHLMLGGTRIKLIQYITKSFFMSIVFGSSIGGLLYYIIFYSSQLKISIFLLVFSFISNITISYILIVSAVFLKANYESKDGDRI